MKKGQAVHQIGQDIVKTAGKILRYKVKNCQKSTVIVGIVEDF